MALIELDNISKLSDKESDMRPILENVSLALDSNSITTIIGPNGAGKSTLAKIMLGLTKPSSGIIRKSRNITAAYAPQHISLNTDLPMTVASFIQSAEKFRLREKSITHALHNFARIENLANKQLSSLSGGELQKIILAFNLSIDADLVVMDEPVQYLDLNSQEEFYSIINLLKQKSRSAFCIISHDLVSVMRSSDKILCLNHHICCSGKASFDISQLENSSKFAHIGIYTHNHDHTH